MRSEIAEILIVPIIVCCPDKLSSGIHIVEPAKITLKIAASFMPLQAELCPETNLEIIERSTKEVSADPQVIMKRSNISFSRFNY